MNGEVIKSFLVGLGFDVDASSLSKFNKAISSAAIKVTALYTSVKVMAAGVGYAISKVSEGFEELGYQYRLIVPTINKTLLLRREMLKAYSAAGINIYKVVQQSVKLNFSLTKTKYAFEAIYKSVAAKFFPLLTKQSDLFRKKLYENMPKIQAALEKFVNFTFKALEATTALGMRLWSILTRVWDFFKMLHDITNGWSTAVLGLVAAWKILNLSFLATPLGMLLTGLLAILALYDDFQVWKEGGESFFDWSAALPTILALKDALSSLYDVLDSIFTIIFNILGAFWKLIHLDFSGATDNLRDAFNSGFLQKSLGLLEKLANAGTIFGTSLPEGGFSVGAQVPRNIENPFHNSAHALLGAQNNGANVNQKVNQETNININGSADANATGRAVASQQSRVNMDMGRNLRGAVKPQ